MFGVFLHVLDSIGKTGSLLIFEAYVFQSDPTSCSCAASVGFFGGFRWKVTPFGAAWFRGLRAKVGMHFEARAAKPSNPRDHIIVDDSPGLRLAASTTRGTRKY